MTSNHPFTIQIAESDADIDRCFPVMHQLRPLLLEETFVALIKRMQQEGYQLAFLECDGAIKAVAGFRITEMLIRGVNMYIDDLVTDEASRSQGYGAHLFNWLVQHARTAGCRQLHLDSGVQRYGAHRFYFRQGMHISSYHFMVDLESA